jgi:hypothetical protein
VSDDGMVCFKRLPIILPDGNKKSIKGETEGTAFQKRGLSKMPISVRQLVFE